MIESVGMPRIEPQDRIGREKPTYGDKRDIRVRAGLVHGRREARWPRWIGWVEEIPGVNSQGRTRDELIENLRSALSEALEMNRAAALAEVAGDFEEVRINP
jgi:hypothetical protein